MLGNTSAATSTIHLAYKTSRYRLRLVVFIDSTRSSGNLDNSSRLLGIYYATHLVPRLGGWIRQGTQCVFSDSSHALRLDAVKLLGR
jgi:hypothetical protein